MSYTEDEAKEKWCFKSERVNNRFALVVDVPAGCGCIGSRCMAWRWENDEDGGTAYKNTPLKDSPGHFENNPLGYCGLAGQPS